MNLLLFFSRPAGINLHTCKYALKHTRTFWLLYVCVCLCLSETKHAEHSQTLATILCKYFGCHFFYFYSFHILFNLYSFLHSIYLKPERSY